MYELGNDYKFPSPKLATSEGIVAVGGDLNPLRVLEAYKNGIFPWFNDDENLIWWSPDPRMVLFPEKIKLSKSFKSFLKKKEYRVSFNENFENVIESCSNIKRVGQKGTWITSGLKKSFNKLHEMGHAHSVEVWYQNVIIGGLYGLDLGNVFCGESMFSTKPNASKVALYFLCHELKSNNYKFIDCQVPSEHLRSLGAEEISRDSFLEKLVNQSI
ncbi:MAG: leucyl/phenylalanyl-tRNA--protein transferase [Cryomorphaceae bacterium]|nr:MAG: leucyl/phenylalanyl-tRNA--protein transferase [Cryomorphaceae bacterium]